MATRKRPTAARKTSKSPRVVAITGALCTIGRGLCARLAADPSIERVVAIDVRTPEELQPGIHFHRLDLSRPSAEQELADILLVEEADTIVHLAYFGAPVPDAAYAHEVEVIGTLHTLTAATAAQVRRIVVRSTSLIYGAHAKNPSLIREEDRIRGSAASRFVNDKVEAEQQVREFAASHPDTQVTILRFASILGPEVHNVFQRYLTGGLSPTLAGFDPLFQAIHQEDAVEALFAAAKGGRGGVFNVSGRGVIPISTALELVGTLPVPLPYGIAGGALRTLRRVGVGIALPAAMLDYLRYPFVMDASRFERELGFTPRYTTLDAVRSLAPSKSADQQA